MTEHEKLKEICDLIGFEYELPWDWDYQPVKLTIFTQEFIDTFWTYIFLNNKSDYWYTNFTGNLMENLDNPTQYLYNTLLWNKN